MKGKIQRIFKSEFQTLGIFTLYDDYDFPYYDPININYKDRSLCELRQFSGIYQIVNNINQSKYIGSAVSLGQRLREHISKLREDKHFNIYLQRAWNKYGEENFKLGIIKLCKKESLVETEQFFIDSHIKDKNKLYNICLIAGSSLGRKHSEEHKKRISSILKGKKARKDDMRGRSNPNWKGGKPNCLDCGNKMTTWHRKRCRKCSNKIISLLNNKKVFCEGIIFDSMKQAASHYKITTSAIRNRIVSKNYVGYHYL